MTNAGPKRLERLLLHWVITKVTQNYIDMYTRESSQQTFNIRNNNLDVGFERA